MRLITLTSEIASQDFKSSSDRKTEPIFSLHSQQRIALLSTAFLFPSAGAALIVPWLLGLRIAQLMRERRLRWVASPFDLWIGIFSLAGLVAGIMSQSRIVALESWALSILASVIVLQATLYTLRESPGFVKSLHRAFAIGTLCAAIYGLVLFHFQHLDRAYLLTLGPNPFAFGLMVGVFLSLPLLTSPAPWPAVSLFTVVLSLLTVIATFSRAALYGLVAGSLTFLWLTWRNISLRHLILVFVSFIVGLLIALSSPSILHKWAIYSDIQSSAGGLAILIKTLHFLFSKEGYAEHDRLLVWQVALKVISYHPWFGVGLGVFSSIAQSTMGWRAHAHSLYLNLAAEIGIPGTIAFLTMPITAILCGLKRRNSYRNGQIAAMVGMLIAEVRDNIIMGFYYMTLGFIVVLAMLVTSDSSKE